MLENETILDFNAQRSFRAMREHLQVNSYYLGDRQTVQPKPVPIAIKWSDLYAMFDRLLLNLRFAPVLIQDEERFVIKTMPHSSGKTTALSCLGVTTCAEQGLTFAQRNHYVAVLAYLVSGIVEYWQGSASSTHHVNASSSYYNADAQSLEHLDHIQVLNRYLANDPVLQGNNYWQVKTKHVVATEMTQLLDCVAPLERMRPGIYYEIRDTQPVDLSPVDTNHAANNTRPFRVSQVAADLADLENVTLLFGNHDSGPSAAQRIRLEQLITMPLTDVIKEIDQRYFYTAYQYYQDLVNESRRAEECNGMSFFQREAFERIDSSIHFLFKALLENKVFQEEFLQEMIHFYDNDVRRAYANVIPQLLFHAAAHPVLAGRLDPIMQQKDSLLMHAINELCCFAQSMTMDFQSDWVQHELFSIVTDAQPEWRGKTLQDYFNFNTGQAVSRQPQAASSSMFSSVNSTLQNLVSRSLSGLKHCYTRRCYYGYRLPDAVLQDNPAAVVLDRKAQPIATLIHAIPTPNVIATAGVQVKMG
jgi:hypothetical protein